MGLALNNDSKSKQSTEKKFPLDFLKHAKKPCKINNSIKRKKYKNF